MRLDGRIVGLALLIIVTALGYALSDTEKSEAQARHDHYCDMVKIYKDSGGEYGWPNYESRECGK